MRLFVAIDIPDTVKDYLKKLQAKIPKIPDEKMRLTTDFHLTLKFLGSVDGNKKKEVEAVLSTVPFRSFEAELTEAGIFFFRGHPRVIWIGVKVPAWLFESQKIMEERLEKIGFEPEHRFSPHLTLARIKFVNTPIERIKIEPMKFPVKHFYLFQSHLSPKGATYEKLNAFPSRRKPSACPSPLAAEILSR